jgi:hypothetical protein
MAVKLQKITSRDALLNVVSVLDSAIDWEASYPSHEDVEMLGQEYPDMELVEAKREHYSKTHDLSKIMFSSKDIPTVFVFEHPHRADVSRAMREIATGVHFDSSKTKMSKSDKDTFSQIFHRFYVGAREGFSIEKMAPLQRINGRLSEDTVQEIEDANVFIELNVAFLNVYNAKRDISNSGK